MDEGTSDFYVGRVPTDQPLGTGVQRVWKGQSRGSLAREEERAQLMLQVTEDRAWELLFSPGAEAGKLTTGRPCWVPKGRHQPSDPPYSESAGSSPMP